MADVVKDKRLSHGPVRDETNQGGGQADVCEICGQVMERDPESGEYYCPNCFFAEEEC